MIESATGSVHEAFARQLHEGAERRGVAVVANELWRDDREVDAVDERQDVRVAGQEFVWESSDRSLQGVAGRLRIGSAAGSFVEQHVEVPLPLAGDDAACGARRERGRERSSGRRPR